MTSASTFIKASLAILVLFSFGEVNGQEKNPDEKLLLPVKYLRVTTNTVFQIVSSTVYPFCITGTFATAPMCAGKRRRRSLPINTDLVEKDSDVEVDGSQNKVAAKEADDSSNREKFFKFTIWNTASYTTSITLLWTNSGTSISLSYVCWAPFMQLPAFCG